jgi:hypothetical protein
MKNLNLQSLRDAIELINKSLSLFSTKDDLSNLDNLLKALGLRVDKHSTEITNIMDLLNDLKNKPAPIVQSKDTASTNDILILRNRMEYVENTLTQFKKQYNELKK